MACSLRKASFARSFDAGSFARSSFSRRPSEAYSRATCEVVNVTSTSGAPLATRALASRSSVPPTSNSTGMPVCAVYGLATTRSMVSFQLPPHTLTTRGAPANEVADAAVAALPRGRVQHDAALGLHGPAIVDADLAAGALGVTPERFEHAGQRQRADRAIHDEAQRAGGVVAEHVDDRAREARVAEIVGGDQEPAGRAAPGPRLRRPRRLTAPRGGREEDQQRDGRQPRHGATSWLPASISDRSGTRSCSASAVTARPACRPPHATSRSAARPGAPPAPPRPCRPRRSSTCWGRRRPGAR